MGTNEQLKQAIKDVIKTNGTQAITGQVMQNALLSMITSMTVGSTFAGIATPETNPGTPDGNVFYIASKTGTYANFNGIKIDGEVVILENKTGSWVKTSTGFATVEKLTELAANIVDYYQGGLDDTTGLANSDTGSCHTGMYQCPEYIYCFYKEGYNVVAYMYDSQHAYTRKIELKSGEEYPRNNADVYIRFVTFKLGMPNFTPHDALECQLHFKHNVSPQYNILRLSQGGIDDKGIDNNDVGSCSTPYIEVVNGDNFIVEAIPNKYDNKELLLAVFMYGDDFVYISKQEVNSTYKIKIESNIRYIRLVVFAYGVSPFLPNYATIYCPNEANYIYPSNENTKVVSRVSFFQGGIDDNGEIIDNNGSCYSDIIYNGVVDFCAFKQLYSWNNNSVVIFLYDKQDRFLEKKEITISEDLEHILYVPSYVFAYYRIVVFAIGVVNFHPYLAKQVVCNVAGITNIPKHSNPITWTDTPDPTIWQDDKGWYYRYTTPQTKNKTIWRSRNLIDWEDTGNTAFDDDSFIQLTSGGYKLWAPDVAYHNGYYYMYISLHKDASDTKIAVLKSLRPDGHFKYVAIVTESANNGIEDTIDPDYVEDIDGVKYLFFGSTGKIHRVKLSDNGETTADSNYVHVAGLSIQEDPTREKVFEAAYLYRHNGYWYLFASSGNYYDYTYSIRVGRSKTLTGDFVDKQGRKMTEGYAEKILQSDEGDELYGPGHNAEIIVDVNMRYFMPYHVHNGGEERYVSVQELRWVDDWPVFIKSRPQKFECSPNL